MYVHQNSLERIARYIHSMCVFVYVVSGFGFGWLVFSFFFHFVKKKIYSQQAREMYMAAAAAFAAGLVVSCFTTRGGYCQFVILFCSFVLFHGTLIIRPFFISFISIYGLCQWRRPLIMMMMLLVSKTEEKPIEKFLLNSIHF